MKRFLLLITFAFGLSYLGWGQFYDGFTGTGNINNSNGWVVHSGSGTIPINSGSLSYSGLQASTGNRVTIPGAGGTVSTDVNAALSIGVVNSAYFSVLINVIDNTQLKTTADYFMCFGATSGAVVSSLASRLGIKSVNAGLNYRLSIGNNSGGAGNPIYTDFATDLVFGTTYLVVVKYDRSVSPTVASLWVNPASLGGSEPSGQVTNSSGTGTFASFASICIRNTLNTPKADIDEIRCGTTWAEVTPSGGSSPSIALSDNGTQVVAGNVTQGTNNNILSTFKLDVTTANATLTAAAFLTAGDYLAADINGNGFKLWYNAANDFATATSIGAAQGSTSTGSGDILTFSSLTQTINSGSTGYFWVSANIAAGATVGRTISLTAIANADLTFSSGTKSGSASAGGTQTIIAPVSPTIFTSGSLTAFTAISGTPSASQSYTVSGDNLTANVLVSAPTKYEVSTDDINFSNTVELTQSGGNIVGEPKTVYVRISATASVGAASGDIAHTSAGATTVNVAVTGTVYAPEPTNHPTTFTATANSSSQITLTWTDATGGQLPDAYLVKAAIDPSTPTAPIDGTAEVNSTLVKNITQGTQTAIFTGLSASTTYNFSIWPYTNSGTNIDYKIGSEPTANATTQAITYNTYTWIGVDAASWAVADNWSPTRTSPETTDILQFNDGTTKTITAVPTQTIGQLNITNNSKITLQAAAAATVLAIGGGSGTDLNVGSGSELNISGANTLTITLSTGANGSIAGSMTVAGAAHKFTSASANGIVFSTGAIFTTSTGFSSNAFGNTTSGSVVFQSGSSYVHFAGSNPFAITPAVAIFETGSLYKQKTNGSPSLSGRTYGNLEIDEVTFSQANMTGGGILTVDNLIITNATLANFNLTGGIYIKGNLQVSTGTVSFTPATASNVYFNGTSTQTISGSGVLSFGANATVNFDNTLIINKNLTINGNAIINNGKSLTLNPTRQLTVTGTLTNNAGTTGLFIKSDATGTGSLMHNSNNVDATIERYLTGNTVTNNTFDFHQVSVPLNADGTAALFNGMYLYKFDQTVQDYVSMGNDPATVLDNNTGYMIFYPNTSTTASMTGQLNNGSFTALTGTDAADEFSLVPNPYPSAINWDAASGWTKTGLQDAFYIWDPISNNYVTWSGGAGTALTANIPVGQSFFVKANAAIAELIMTNAVRTHSTQAFWKETESIVPEVFRLKVSDNESADEMIVRFNNEAANDRGFLDVDKLYGANIAPQLYSVTTNDDKLTINALNHSTQTIAVPVGIEYPVSKSLTFNASGFESFESSVTIFLEDKLLNKTIDLRENPVYTFTNAAGADPMRFNLLFYGVNSTNELSTANYKIWVNNDKINILIPELMGKKAVVELIDQQGRILITQSVTLDSPSVINTSVSSGLYIVRVVSGKQAFTSKVFIR
jgi:hypothetical protein